jgi:hypothetical protein
MGLGFALAGVADERPGIGLGLLFIDGIPDKPGIGTGLGLTLGVKLPDL